MKVISLCILILSLTACATGYRSAGLGGGYSEIQLNKDTFVVNYQGNGFTNNSRLTMLILYRCADLTLLHGYRYFIIVNGNQEVQQSVYQTPATVNTYSNGIGNYMGTNRYGTMNYLGNSTSVYNPGQTISISRLTNHVIIKMLSKK